MKRTRILGLAAGFLILSAGFIGCTKEGPQGPAGTNGTNGVDANATCTQCHNFSDTIVTKIFQYESSQHATGSTTFEGTRKDCAPCHTSQGFKDVVASNQDTSDVIHGDANRIDCRTCHQIHKTYTETDWALLTTAAFNPRYDKTQTIDLTAENGTGNLCGRCHQARKASPALNNPTSADPQTITSSRWGPHHGTQANVLSGKGAIELGGTAYGNSPHATVASCNTCHMGYPQGNLVGGHTWRMENEESGDNVTVCKTCHGSISGNFDLNGKQSEIADLLDQLKLKLAEANVLDTNTMLLKANVPHPQNQLSAYWNYQMFREDRSNGVHNYVYAKEAITASLAIFAK